MINLKFSERSLLYGYSYLWALVQAIFPPLYQIDSSKTKNPIVFLHIPFFRDLFYGPEWASVRRRWGRTANNINLFTRYLLVVGHLFYLASLMFINFEVQGTALKKLGVKSTDSLTYKALYYTPPFMVSFETKRIAIK